MLGFIKIYYRSFYLSRFNILFAQKQLAIKVRASNIITPQVVNVCQKKCSDI